LAGRKTITLGSLNAEFVEAICREKRSRARPELRRVFEACGGGRARPNVLAAQFVGSQEQNFTAVDKY